MAEALMKLVGEVNWASGEGKSFVETYDQVFRSVAELDEKQDSKMLVEILMTRIQAWEVLLQDLASRLPLRTPLPSAPPTLLSSSDPSSPDPPSSLPEFPDIFWSLW